MLTSYYTMPSINYSSKFFESWKFCQIRCITHHLTNRYNKLLYHLELIHLGSFYYIRLSMLMDIVRHIVKLDKTHLISMEMQS